MKAPPPLAPGPLALAELGSAPLGEWVVLRATIHGQPLVRAPLSDVMCVHAEVLVMIWNEEAGAFRPVIEERSWSPRVTLRDHGGEAVIEADAAFLLLRVSELREVSPGEPIPAAIRGLLATHRVIDRGRLKYRETRLENGDTVFVRARLTRTPEGLILVGDDEEKPSIAVEPAMLAPI